jgi:hypothetical protein
MVTTEAEFTRLESELSFLQVRSTMTLQETIHKVKAEICQDRKQIAHTRLESIAGEENPYSLMQVFERGHQVTRNGVTVYVTRCQAKELLLRTHTNCTNEIPAILNWSIEFLCRRDNDQVYPVPIDGDVQAARGSSTTVNMNVEDENNKGGQPRH